MLKPLSRRQLDAVRADPIYYDGAHRDHDAYVAMVGGEYRRHYDPDLHRKMAEPNRPRFDPAKIKLNGAVGPRASANNSHDERRWKMRSPVSVPSASARPTILATAVTTGSAGLTGCASPSAASSAPTGWSPTAR